MDTATSVDSGDSNSVLQLWTVETHGKVASCKERKGKQGKGESMGENKEKGKGKIGKG